STITLTAFYNESPVIEAAARLEGQGPDTSITNVTYYAWGASVTVQDSGSSAATLTHVIEGKPLRIQNRQRVVAEDADSIIENGRLTYRFPDNPLVQTLDVAQKIADSVLEVYKLSRRDVEIDWRGNPALTLGDVVTLPDFLDSPTGQ